MDTSHLVSKNQIIKIVPSVEESLRAKGLNVDLDENTVTWLNQLKLTWRTWKKSIALDSHVEMFYQSRPNDAYRIALVFIVKCEESKDCKPKSLPYYILEILHKWSQQSKVLPENELKMPAFHIAIQQRNNHFLNLIARIYHLSTIKEVIIPFVRAMIQNDNCKQASQVVIALELFDDIPVEDLLFPLILQDKPSMIDEYLTECPSQVKPLLLFLDKLLDKRFSIREYVQNYTETNKICHIKSDKMHYRPLGKLVARLCNKFNIPIETCKNLSRNRTTGGLKYLIHQKYQEHNVSSTVWDDLVKDSLKQNEASGYEFIDMLVDYDQNEALKWALYLNIPKTNLPLALKELSLSENNEEDNWDTDVTNVPEYYKFTLSDDKIVMIDNGEKFYDLMMSGLAEQNIVSLDCEWKPSFGATQSHVALIQVATNEKVYLIDTLILNKPEYASFWYTFYKSFLDNAEIIKLGFGLEQDLKEMKASVTGLSNIKVKGEGLLDLGILWKTLLNNGLILPSNSDSGGNSLSSLVQSCFGHPLEKSEQCSNWELRPLRKTQIQYAALDALVLIQIYNFVQKLCEQQKLKFEDICNNVMLEKKKKCTRKVKIIDRIQSSLPSRSVHDIKFIIEPQISYLAPYLRYCGIDTTIIGSTLLWCDVINLAISEDRIILLGKLKSSPTIDFPQTSILDVGKGTITEQLQRIFYNFHLDIKKENLLTICIHCNGKTLTKMSPEELLKIYENYQTPVVETNNSMYVPEYDNNDAGYENFLSDSDSDDDLRRPATDINVNNESCKTKTGIPIELGNVHQILDSNKPAILCESCGKLFWEDHDLMKAVSTLIFNLTKLTLWQ